MKLKVQIPRKIIIRLAIALAITGGAWLFDSCHQGNSMVLDEIEHSESAKSAESILFYFNPVIQVSLKIPVGRPSLKKVFYETDNKLILLHHSSRAYHLLKAEPIVNQRPIWLTQHTIIFRHHYSGNHDDWPLASNQLNLQG